MDLIATIGRGPVALDSAIFIYFRRDGGSLRCRLEAGGPAAWKAALRSVAALVLLAERRRQPTTDN